MHGGLFMQRAGGLLAAVMSLSLAGCVSPLVKPNPLEMQYRVQNAIHWQDLAKRTVAAVPYSEPGIRVFVVPPNPDNRFSPIYRRYLEEALYKKNYTLVNQPHEAQILIHSIVEPLLYDNSGKKLWGYATTYTTAATVGAQFRDISSLDTGLAAGMVTGLAFDFAYALTNTTRAEVIVSTQITDSQTSKVHFARSESFYVRPADLEQFYVVDNPPPVVALRVTNGAR